MKISTLAILLLLLVSTAYGESISASAPKDGAVVGTTVDISFTIATAAVTEWCAIIVDSEAAKNISYNGVLKGRSISTKVTVDEGVHQWQVMCQTSNETALTAPQSFTAKTIAEQNLEVVASGTIRGSMSRIVRLDDQPVTVPKIAAGDYLIIAKPISRELYVKQMSSQDGKPYVRLQENNTQYLLQQNEQFQLNGTDIMLNFTGIELNRATIVVSLAGVPSASPPPQEPDDSVTGNGSVDAGTDQDTPASPGIKPTKPEQGVLKRFLSWIVTVFG
jgi:hypothetical protein